MRGRLRTGASSSEISPSSWSVLVSVFSTALRFVFEPILSLLASFAFQRFGLVGGGGGGGGG